MRRTLFGQYYFSMYNVLPVLVYINTSRTGNTKIKYSIYSTRLKTSLCDFSLVFKHTNLTTDV